MHLMTNSGKTTSIKKNKQNKNTICVYHTPDQSVRSKQSGCDLHADILTRLYEFIPNELFIWILNWTLCTKSVYLNVMCNPKLNKV